MSEQQRTAIVTGAAGGIGRELVLGLLGKGLKVAAVDRTAQGLAELAQATQERQRGANLLTIEADLARDQAIDEIVAKARGRFGVIDILVNNAGVGQATIRSDNRQRPIKFWEVTPELWKLFVAVHNNAPMALSRAVVHDMMRQKWGRIVNITTSLGTMIREGSPTYGPSKAALEAFSAIMAKDLAGTGVTVNVLVPLTRATVLRSSVSGIVKNCGACGSIAPPITLDFIALPSNRSTIHAMALHTWGR
jgi:NAD(P)-dependent dehydrogenase (short-subunit alcohol dehydrogenase family)